MGIADSDKNIGLFQELIWHSEECLQEPEKKGQAEWETGKSLMTFELFHVLRKD